MADDESTGNEEWRPFREIGADMSMNQRRMTPITEDRKQTHALEHIARVLDRIDAKLDTLLERLPPPGSAS